MYRKATPAARPNLFVVPTNKDVIAASQARGIATAIIPTAKMTFLGIRSTTKNETQRPEIETKMIPAWNWRV
jgi:hypothetical protein